VGAVEATGDDIMWRMRAVCWTPKATEADSDYVILIGFPLQQCLHERASLLCYTYIACPVSTTSGTVIYWNLPACPVSTTSGTLIYWNLPALLSSLRGPCWGKDGSSLTL